MTVGIYKITNKINGKCYIGQSIDIEARWKKHVSQLDNKAYSRARLYQAFRKYGVEAFEFEILEECERENLNELEIAYIAKYRSYQEGYNMTLGGEGLGRVFSEEHRRNLSISHKGHKPSAEANRKRSESLRRTMASEEVRKRMGESRKGKPRPEEVRRKISAGHKGKTLTMEHRKKLSKAQTGKSRKHSEETLRKIRESQRGPRGQREKNVRCNGVVYPTVKQCAAELGVSASTLSRWLHGINTPKDEMFGDLSFVNLVQIREAETREQPEDANGNCSCSG